MKAFPNHRSEGMELRDYFAAKAMVTLIDVFKDHPTSMEPVAQAAYRMAEEMMKAREKKNETT